MEQRRRQAAESLARHSLFSFQIHDAAVAGRVRELRQLLLATCGEADQPALLADQVRDIEEQLQSQRDARERFLLEPLRRFAQEMELLLDVDSGSDELTEEDEEEDENEDEDEDKGQEDAELPPQTPTAQPMPVAEKKDVKDEEDVRCGVCAAPDSPENDLIVICELCGVAVHQTCYRLATLPEGDWYCHPCKQYMDAQDIEKSLIPTHELQCEACNVKAGAFAPAVDGGWIHVACSMFLPELYMQDQHASIYQGQLDDLQVVCGVEKLRARRKLRCCFCKKTSDKGACAQCAVGKCTVAYHALCALQNGIKLRYMEEQGQFGSGCLKHQSKFLKMEGLSAGESDEDNAVIRDSQSSKSMGNKQQAKRSRKNSSSAEDDSESDDADEDENELDSDSEHGESDDSVSDDERDIVDEHVKTPALTTSVKESPPRLLGGPSLRKGSQMNRSNRSRQIALSFESAKPLSTHTKPSRSTTPALTATTPSNPVADRQDKLPTTLKHNNTVNRIVLQSNVFAPVFYPQTYKPDDDSEREYEYLMVLILTQPFGLGVRSMHDPNAQGIFLQAKTTANLAIAAALERGVIQDGDEVFAFNDQVLRSTGLEQFKKLVSTLDPPVRCWFRTKRKTTKVSKQNSVSVNAGTAIQVGPGIPATGSASEVQKASVSPFATMVASPPDSCGATAFPGSDDNNDSVVVSLGIDWPWVFLRSDGKLAMNVFWRTLDTAFFLRKINKRTFTQLQEKVEDLCGIRLSSSHPEYQQVRDLLVMPKRERLPAYLVEFRKIRKQKQTFLSSDIFMGVASETNSGEAEVDEQTAIAVGTTVTVAKRTWPGINKLGGVGRIKKVNEETLPDGKKRFTYNVVYIMGGHDKNVERKYISVVDLDAEEPVKSEESNVVSTSRSKPKPEPETKNAAADTEMSSFRLAFDLELTGEEEKLLALPDLKLEHPPTRRRIQLQFSTDNATVFCQRVLDQKVKDSQQGDATPAKDLLLHRHFDVKLPKNDILMNECFSSRLVSVEDRVGDEVDEDDSESENEEDEIKTELASLQEQFRAVVDSNEQIFSTLTTKVEEEYASKEYRQRGLQDIQWRNYERMYKEVQAAKRQFDDSDDENEDVHEHGRVPGSTGGKGRAARSKGEDDESESEDVSCGGLFVNKLKQEGSEVCALCELSGGDFAAADNGSVVHPQCAMFTPETFFKDGVVHGIDQVSPERRRLACNICGGRKGLSKIQCASRKCTLAYHVACAYVNGLLTRDPYYQAWCPRHLKSSGMAHFVEMPEHLKKQLTTDFNTDTPEQPTSSSRRSRKPHKQRSSNKKKRRQDTTPGESTIAAPGTISSSKTDRKRKRKISTSGSSNTKNARGSSPGQAIVVDEQEPRCARRLEIDDLGDSSDQEGKAVEAWQAGHDQDRAFSKNDVVEVLKRDWRGINKPGGVARVRAVNVQPNQTGGKDVSYDVNYIVSGFKEKNVAARFVRGYNNAE